MSIARYFVGTDEHTYIPGVPAADLEQEEFDALPDHVKASVDASNLYRKTKPRDDSHAAAPKADEKKEGA